MKTRSHDSSSPRPTQMGTATTPKKGVYVAPVKIHKGVRDWYMHTMASKVLSVVSLQLKALLMVLFKLNFHEAKHRKKMARKSNY